MEVEEDNPFDRYREDVDRPLIRLFREYGLPRIRWFSVGVIANLIGRGAALLPPIVLGAAIDSVLRGDGEYTLPFVPQSWIPPEPEAQFWLSVALIGGAFFTTAFFTWIWGVTANLFAHGVLHDVRTDTFEKMELLDMEFFDNKQTGEVMSVLNNDASNLEIFLDNALSEAVRIIITVIGISLVLFYLNYQLAFVTLIAVPLMVLFTVWFMKKVEPRYERVRSSVGDLNTRLENSLSGIELVKISNTDDYEADRVSDASKEFYDANMSVLRLSYFYRPGMELLAGAAFAATFTVGGIWLFTGPPLFFSGELTVGEFVIFIFMTQRFVDPLSQVSNIVDWYENAKASSERIFGLMDIPVNIEDGTVELDNVEGMVEYKEVEFSYEDETVISDVSFDVASGETVGIVGPTGAGKSTLVKLLFRLYDVDAGKVTIDGKDIRETTFESLRGSLGYVSQDTFLFDATVKENIAYGEFDASDEEVVEAAKTAEAHGFITELSDGYDTRVGERGVKLSGGQRQRIAIARSVLRDPEILVLDEATSSVDTRTEMMIQRSLETISEDRTTIVIAHRLSTVKDADKIIVLDEGSIVERGTHDDLLEKDGLYSKLWRIQSDMDLPSVEGGD